jgi:phosphonate transport system permease protein
MHAMTASIQHLPDRQLAPLLQSYGLSVSRRRRRFWLGALCFACLSTLAGWWVGLDLHLLFEKIGAFGNYFGRLSHLDDGTFVWTDPLEWFWGWKKWLAMLGETLLIAYTGTLLGAIGGFALCFLCASNLARPLPRWFARRTLEFCRTVPEIVFALIFVLAFGLGPMAGVLALAIHTMGSLGKLFTEIVENIDMKAVDGISSTGGTHFATVAYAVVPQVVSGFATYTLLRFEMNFRGASIMGLVGAGGIGQELLTAVRKFYYADVSALLVMIIVTVFILDGLTARLLRRLNTSGHTA